METNQKILDNFIVIEGLDGAGTTTQLSLIEKHLKNKSIKHFITFEPTNNKTGNFIRSILKGAVTVEPNTMSYLFAADRCEHLYNPNDGIVAKHSKGNFIVCDRYLFSSLAYQSVSCGFDFVLKLNSFFPLPSHLFFIKTSIDTCMLRLKSREGKEIYEDYDFQKEVERGYNKVLSYYEKSKMNIHFLDGEQNPEDIFQKIWDIISLLPIFKE